MVAAREHFQVLVDAVAGGVGADLQQHSSLRPF